MVTRGILRTCAFPYHLDIFMRMHMRAPMFFFVEAHPECRDFWAPMCIDVATHLLHIRVCNHFWCLCVETHTYWLVLEVSDLETHARFLVFFPKQEETHARSTPTFSHLLFNSWKRQILKSCSVALCAITFQLQPCFPWNCAPLEQKVVLPYKTSV